MRMREIPRGLPDDGSIAEALEIGAGMKDSHAKHGMSGTERRHFDEVGKRPIDPRDASSNLHDLQPPIESSGVLIDDTRGVASRRDSVCRGEVVGCFMQPGGAHIELADEAGVVHFLFWDGVQHIVMGANYVVMRRAGESGDRLLFKVNPPG